MGLYSGKLPGGIGDIRSWEEIFTACGARYVVLACLDSNQQPGRSKGIRKYLQKAGVEFETAGDFVVFTSEVFRTALSVKGCFCGFDELWFHESIPGEEEMCKRPITSDGTNLAEKVPEDLVEKFEASSAVLGLGDGCGLNFITKREEIAELIQRDVEGKPEK